MVRENSLNKKLLIPEQKLKNENIINPKSKLSFIIYGLVLSSGGFSYGFNNSFYNNFYTKFISEIYKITDQKRQTEILTNLTYTFFIGGLISSLIAFYIYENIGRLKAFYYLIFLNILVCIINNIYNVNTLYIGRILSGYIGCFWMFLSHLMIKEIVYEEIRAVIANSFFLFLILGTNFAFFISSAENVFYWRFIMFSQLIIEIPRLLLIILFFRIKSPIYLYKKYFGNLDLQNIISKNYQVFYTVPNSNKLAKKFITERSNKKKKEIKIKDLLSKKYRTEFFFGIFINILVQITGILCLSIFSTKIFTINKIPNPEFVTKLMGIIYLISGIFSTIIANKIGKRKPLFYSLSFQSISWMIFLLGIYYQINFFVILGSYVFIFFYTIFSSIQFSYLVDFLPAKGLSLSSTFKWIVNIILVKYLLYFVEYFGIFAVFFGFMIICIISSIIFYFFSLAIMKKKETEIIEKMYLFKI